MWAEEEFTRLIGDRGSVHDVERTRGICGGGYLLELSQGRVGDHGLPAPPGPPPLADVGQDRLVELRTEL